MLILLFVLGLVIGGVIGGIIGCIFTRNSMTKKLFVGTLRVDTSDPDDHPYMFLELSTNVDAVTSKKCVVLKVSTENYISQK